MHRKYWKGKSSWGKKISGVKTRFIPFARASGAQSVPIQHHVPFYQPDFVQSVANLLHACWVSRQVTDPWGQSFFDCVDRHGVWFPFPVLAALLTFRPKDQLRLRLRPKQKRIKLFIISRNNLTSFRSLHSSSLIKPRTNGSLPPWIR